MSEPIRAIVVGAGQRGYEIFGNLALQHPELIRFVAVAEPDTTRRERFADAHAIPSALRFSTWQDLISASPTAEACFVLLGDDLHYAVAEAALEARYKAIFLEKPIATRIEDVVALTTRAEALGAIVHVAHVLRYTTFFNRFHQVLASGVLGELISVSHNENVSSMHMAHSFVRGNWRSTQQTPSMLLAKSCHDLDILTWNLDSPVARIQSFGSLQHFRPERAPEGAPNRCIDGCPASDDCPFDAKRIYLQPESCDWPVSVIGSDLSQKGREDALRTGPYGRCVYRCDNDVVDHQTVGMELESGVTVTLTMHGHSHLEGRTMRYDGSHATVLGNFAGPSPWIEIHNHARNSCERIEIASESGHGGGDLGALRAFHKAVSRGDDSRTTLRESLESHILAFAAERARLEGRVLNMGDYRAALFQEHATPDSDEPVDR